MNKTQVARAIAAWVSETGDRETTYRTTTLISYLKHQGFTETEILPEVKRVASEYFEQIDGDSFRLSGRGMRTLADLSHPAAVANYEAQIRRTDGIGLATKFFLTKAGMRQWIEAYTAEADTVLTLYRNGSKISLKDL